ncbi:hypothetical protein A3841_07540 [Pontibacter flavimaris]|uniref:histidine kinase n=1 Tax=Pontibacter flavimaris TaxID=1797110 RepID=A0A1Q5PI14_9BACT|nr:hypothetical protein A3841_07540 [Pontibacter flavimaris]
MRKALIGNGSFARFILCVLLLAILTPALSQRRDLSFQHLTASEGLSQSSVISITQDHRGLMWFGTRDGLNKYDGNRFTVYRHNAADLQSISHNDIIEVITDTKGDLWVGTFNGLNKYDYEDDKFISYFNIADDSTTISGNSVWAVHASSSGDVWVGTSKGLNRFDRETNTFQRFYHNPNDAYSLSDSYVKDIFEDSEGFIWVATTNGLNKMIVSSKGRIRFDRYLNEPGNSASLNDNFTQVITEDARGDLWIGTKSGGLNKLDRKSNTFRAYQHHPADPNSLSDNDVRALAFNEQGELLIGTYGGFNVLDLRNERFHRMVNNKDNPGSLSKNSVKSIYVDTNGSIWVGTYYGGINMADPQHSNFRNYRYKSGPAGMSFDVVSAMVEDRKGNLYIGTEGGGINVLHPATQTFSYIEKGKNSISSNNIKSLYLDAGNNLWIGTFNEGLDILNLQTGAVRHFEHGPDTRSSLSDNNIYAIVQQDDSLFWLGSYGGGLNLFNIRSGRIQSIRAGDACNLTSNLVRSVLKDSRGNLWLGTQYGLNRIPVAEALAGKRQFQQYFFGVGESASEDVTVLFEDSQARVWAGTNKSGLNLFNPSTGKFTNYDLCAMTGSASNIIHGILEDKSRNLWISTNQGILKFNPETGAYKVFSEADGVISNEYNNNSSLRTRSGHMYFGSVAGLTSFHPDSIVANAYTPAVVLTNFKLFGQTVKPATPESVLRKAFSETKELTLDYDQAIFTIEFAIPNFINSQKNHYAYRLKGLEENWVYTSDNSATYTIQQPGTYTFEVKAANSDNTWNPTPTTLQVTVDPAPWKTWWAFLLYGCIILIALYLLVNIILSRSKLRHELELEHLQHEKQQSLNKMKLQFFTNISHELRTPLTLVLGPLGQLIENFKGEKREQKQLLEIESNANRMLHLIDELMDFRKLEDKHLQLKVAEEDLVSFVEGIFQSFRQYAGVLQFEYTFEAATKPINVWFDRDKMERVVFNLISNAFKYTPPGGKVAVRVDAFADHVEIKVSDTGIGIDQEHIGKIFDRFYEVDSRDRLLVNKYNKGTGIGLALAKGIVDLHAGTIRVDSKKDEGSTFIVSLPVGHQHLSQNQMLSHVVGKGLHLESEVRNLLPLAQAEEGEEMEKGVRHEASILVVEDNEELRRFIKQLFQDNYTVWEAGNGREGMELALGHSPDMIISDVMMPEMDGIEFCSRLKSDIRTSHIPVILLTARTSPDAKFDGLETGADDYITKPFDARELKIKVRNLVQSQKKLRERFASESFIKPSDITITSMDEKLLEKALQIVEENISNENFDIATFCEELGVSRTMLFTKIKAWTNLTPNDFILTMRMKRAAQLLEQNKLNISQVGFEVGFKNPKYFSKCFQRHFSETPTAYARKFLDSEKV